MQPNSQISSSSLFVIVLLFLCSTSVYSFRPRKSHSLRHIVRVSSTSPSSTDPILRRIDKWACVKGCGACCKLGPIDSRPELASYLTTTELDLYKSMIGEDDWCKHFDQTNRMCTIYDSRPTFCVVDPKKYKTMFDVDQEDLNNFCQFCCTEQIADVYGEDSPEMEVLTHTL